MLKKIFFSLFLLLLVFVLVYLLGPRQKYEAVDPSPISKELGIDEVASYISEKVGNTIGLKPNNESLIVWADTLGKRSEYAIVYLHGYSASREEGAPIHREIAQKYGANLYMPRLAFHGLTDSLAFEKINAKDLVESAKEAIWIGKSLGEKVIIMGSSTGGTLGIYAAAHDPDIHSLILYSPNIDLADPSSVLVTGPWGLPILRRMFAGDYREFKANPEQRKYWNHRYRLEGLICLKDLINQTMTDQVLEQVEQPLLIAFYPNDELVSVPRMKEFYQLASTAEKEKRIIGLASTKSHVLHSKYWSKDLAAVKNETVNFAEEVLGLQSIK